ncbi:PPOX class F420-dependent oxidoreductase [Actinocrinis puniceicyclus]|uniref:PPOX class F420-dependent oxidoreductase n=1 Tax=Actinocrinis puniceicyclus TaxID=977794 RepID=A0A8J7WNT6_9ACTN|nr:PPOX class F420-dependent oxidoreductase [Actinocrinis puniceicyclus]MBS2965801.1 PPOX class F420-dependent oxidoreductase [Actinocrinis puniceicyclus]
MATPPVPARIDTFLARPNPAVIATVRPDGQPVSVPTWYLWEGGRVLVNMDEGRKRLEYLRAEPKVALSVLADGDWYSHVSLTGRVVSLEDDPQMADIDRIARHYGLPGGYPTRDRGRVSAWIEIDSWHSWGALQDTGA